MTILDEILTAKRAEVAAARSARPLAEVESAARAVGPVRGLEAALRRPPGTPVRVIAEIKRASPSAGPIRAGADPAAIARDYARGGASALSVLTDRQFFDGELGFLARARAAVTLPLLRKDFVIDAYQIAEARAAGADGVLLIVAGLAPAELAELIAAARAYQLDALVEVHDVAEVDAALAAGASLIGVNHRDLKTFAMDMTLTAQIAPRVPAGVVLVGESGIRNAADVDALGRAGAHAVLVGEHLMRAESPGDALLALRGVPRPAPTPAPTKIKICGVTRPDDAAAIVAAGVDFIGLNFYPGSKRCLPVDRAVAVAAAARGAGPAKLVGVFVNAALDDVVAIARDVAIDVIQLHGDETPRDVAAIAQATGCAVWKAVAVGRPSDLDRLDMWPVDAILLDAPTAARGGAGKVFDWSLARNARRAYPARRFVLAGGLRPDNVRHAIEEVAPWMVDVASGVESAPGIKDPAKLAAFIAEVRGRTPP